MLWVKKADIPRLHTVNDLLELLQVMTDDTLTEFLYEVENDNWKVVLK